LKKELATMNFELSHSSALNLASKSLGFKNYQTYTGLGNDVFLKNEKYFNKKLFLNKTSFDSLNEKFNIYIDIELEYDDAYNLVIELKGNHTGQIFFSPTIGNYFVFPYPNNKNEILGYPCSFHINFFEYSHMIRSLSKEKWFSQNMLNDLMYLAENIEAEKFLLSSLVKKYPNKELEKQYKEQKND
jgi:hypothetical protein